MKWTPDPYMLRGVKFLVERACAGLFWDPGLRKTSVTLAALDTLLKAKVARGALVMCPLRVAYGVWPREVAKWDDFKHLRVGVMHGPRKDAVFDDELDLYVMNYEGLPWLFDRLAPLSPDEWPFDVFVGDESSKLRNMRTERFRMLKPLLKHLRRRYLLTGSPAPKNLLDLFGQMYVLDEGATLGRYYSHYRAEHFYESGYGGYTWKIQPGHDKIIYKKIAPRVLRNDEKDHLKLPPLNIDDVEVVLPPAARRVYDAMENDLQTQVESGKASAANAGVGYQKCRQIAGGAIYMTDDAGKRTWDFIHDVKIKALRDEVDEFQGQGVMIVYEFQHELERIKEEFPDAVDGTGASPKRALEIEDAWNRGEIDKLLVQPQSMGHGLNLQEGGAGQIWYTPTDNYELWDQTIRRMYRSGRKRPVSVRRLVAKDTVDETACDTIEVKGRRQTSLLDALRAYWKRRSV